jgi:hypothetical protein
MRSRGSRRPHPWPNHAACKDRAEDRRSLKTGMPVNCGNMETCASGRRRRHMRGWATPRRSRVTWAQVPRSTTRTAFAVEYADQNQRLSGVHQGGEGGQSIGGLRSPRHDYHPFGVRIVDFESEFMARGSGDRVSPRPGRPSCSIRIRRTSRTASGLPWVE